MKNAISFPGTGNVRYRVRGIGEIYWIALFEFCILRKDFAGERKVCATLCCARGKARVIFLPPKSSGK